MTITPARENSFRGSTGRTGLSIALVIALVTALPITAHAQAKKNPDAAKADRAKGAVQQAESKGFPLQAAATAEDVQQNVSVEAVLLPPKITNKIFGKEIGQNYAAIALTISNRSTDASLVVHSIFIDYSGWLLSGSCQTMFAEDPCAQPAGKDRNDNPPKQAPEKRNALGPWQSPACTAQIASTEYRLVRGELLEAQPWTARNWIIRSLVAVGSIASAYTFTTSKMTTVEGINAFNGQVIPALQTFWPDPVVGQMNNISDLAFRVNKVIDRQGSDIVVAFYPIDRFLTPGFRKLFLSSPAVFFSPESMLVDPDAKKKMLPFIEPLLPPNALDILSQNELRIAAGGCSQKPVPSELQTPCELHALLNRVSLNTVRVVVGGIMTVDVSSVPARIDSVDFNPPSGVTLAAAFARAGEIEGVIRGSFLSGGQPAIVEAEQYGITNVSAVQEGSTDSELHFKMKLKKALPADAKKLTFSVTKKDKQNRIVGSAPKEYTLPPAPAAPAQEKPAPAPATPPGAAKP